MDNFLGSPVTYGIITAIAVLSGIVFVQLGEISLLTKVLRSEETTSGEHTVKLQLYRKRVAWIIAGLICLLFIFSIETT
jgi:hypothetical protein